jgi:hypothetical protein
VEFQMQEEFYNIHLAKYRYIKNLVLVIHMII